MEQGAEQRKGPATTGGGRSAGAVVGGREVKVKGERGGLAEGATVNGLGAWEVAEGRSTG